jgi:hypothetical protein
MKRPLVKRFLDFVTTGVEPQKIEPPGDDTGRQKLRGE